MYQLFMQVHCNRNYTCSSSSGKQLLSCSRGIVVSGFNVIRVIAEACVVLWNCFVRDFLQQSAFPGCDTCPSPLYQYTMACTFPTFGCNRIMFGWLTGSSTVEPGNPAESPVERIDPAIGLRIHEWNSLLVMSCEHSHISMGFYGVISLYVITILTHVTLRVVLPPQVSIPPCISNLPISLWFVFGIRREWPVAHICAWKLPAGWRRLISE